jgi:hypothetical protein
MRVAYTVRLVSHGNLIRTIKGAAILITNLF